MNRKLPRMYVAFDMKPGMGKNFIQDHDFDFKPFKTIPQLINFYRKAVSMELENPVFYSCISMVIDGCIKCFRCFL